MRRVLRRVVTIKSREGFAWLGTCLGLGFWVEEHRDLACMHITARSPIKTPAIDMTNFSFPHPQSSVGP